MKINTNSWHFKYRKWLIETNGKYLPFDNLYTSDGCKYIRQILLSVFVVPGSVAFFSTACMMPVFFVLNLITLFTGYGLFTVDTNQFILDYTTIASILSFIAALLTIGAGISIIGVLIANKIENSGSNFIELLRERYIEKICPTITYER